MHVKELINAFRDKWLLDLTLKSIPLLNTRNQSGTNPLYALIEIKSVPGGFQSNREKIGKYNVKISVWGYKYLGDISTVSDAVSNLIDFSYGLTFPSARTILIRPDYEIVELDKDDKYGDDTRLLSQQWNVVLLEGGLN